MSFMRVLFSVIYNKGGMSDVAKSLIKGISQSANSRAYLVVFYDPSLEIPDSSSDRIIYVPDANLSRSIMELPKGDSKELTYFLRKWQITHVVCDYYTFQFFKYTNLKMIADIHYLIRAANRLSRPKSSFYNHGLSPQQEVQFSRLQLLKEKEEKALLERSELIVCNSLYTKTCIGNLYTHEVSSKKLAVVPVALCLSDEYVGSAASMGKSEMLYHGRFNSVKRVDLLIENGDQFACSLHIYGMPEKVMQELKKQQHSNIHFHSWQTMTSELLEQYRFHIFPSDYEPWGLALTKSRLAGAICLVSMKGGGHLEQIRHGEDGFIIDFHQTNFIERLNEILARSKDDLNLIASRARNKALKEIKGSYLESYTDLILEHDTNF